MAGRPTVLTDEIHRKVVGLVRAGAPRITAARACRISKNVITNWERRGESGKAADAAYEAFCLDLQEASALFEIERLDAIKNAQPAVTGERGADVWQASAWILERLYPQRYSARVRATVDEELAAFMRKIEANTDAETFTKVVHAATREDVSGEGEDAQKH